jgi:hypothetical protein
MALPLKRLDVLIRGNSNISEDDAIAWCKKWANERQNSDDNLDKDGNQKEAFYIDLFDSRNSNSFKVFSDVATNEREIKNTYTTSTGEEIEGVITVFVKKNLINEIVTMVKNTSSRIVNIENIQENPYIYDGEYKFIVAETDNEIAELRVDGNKIYIYDASAFAEEKQLLDLQKHPTSLRLMILK